ncbi:hypothetical protein LCGC14_1463700 [marine sediment metagenome]|uniref:Uncharacterized protein n=1 Tax=marine sediment metagenome TaxID=412755 RepID=A0A0F9JEC2_9ZZZZ
MKANEAGFRNLVKLAMKYKVRTTGNEKAECLVCGWQCGPGFASQVIDYAPFWAMEGHIKDHIERDEITERKVINSV